MHQSADGGPAATVHARMCVLQQSNGQNMPPIAVPCTRYKLEHTHTGCAMCILHTSSHLVPCISLHICISKRAPRHTTQHCAVCSECCNSPAQQLCMSPPVVRPHRPVAQIPTYQIIGRAASCWASPCTNLGEKLLSSASHGHCSAAGLIHSCSVEAPHFPLH